MLAVHTSVTAVTCCWCRNAGPIALLEGVCRFVPSLVRIDPSAVALPPDAHDAPQLMTSEEKQSSSSTSSSNRNNSRDGGYKLEWREFTSLAAAAGLAPATVAEGKSDGSNGDGDGGGAVEVSTSTSKPGSDAEG